VIAARLRALAQAGACAAVIALCACAGPNEPAKAAAPAKPVPADGSIRVTATPVPLMPGDPGRIRVGELVYAGGVALTSADTSRLHGLSGLDVDTDGVSFIAQSDDGDLVTGRLVLDAKGRLAGVAGVRLQPLRDEQGRPLQGKGEGDAEGLTLLPGAGFAVSFERDHRILAYARPGGPGRLVWRQSAADSSFSLADNQGVEALAAGPDDDTLFLGSERGDIRKLSRGRLAATRLAPEPPAGYSLTELDGLNGEDWIAIYRAWDPLRGSRAVIAALPQARCIRAPCEAPHGLVELAKLDGDYSVDNFEAIAAVPLPGGGWRIYLLSDDNFRDSERTLLLAFDWRS
jgi:hypothetical protein